MPAAHGFFWGLVVAGVATLIITLYISALLHMWQPLVPGLVSVALILLLGFIGFGLATEPRRD